MINVLIYNEFVHEKKDEIVRKIYPDGIHSVIKNFLQKDAAIGNIRCATLEDHREVMSQENLDDTDVTIWWGHAKHTEVDDGVVERTALRVLDGMGLIVLHSGHNSKIFKKILGTRARLRWREVGEKARIWTIVKNHPITQGLPDTFTVPHEEMYGEVFEVPTPEELIFITWFQGGEVFRSGCTWHRGEGKIFYFQNGHETFPIYHQEEIQRIITNAVKWAAPLQRSCINVFSGPKPPYEEF